MNMKFFEYKHLPEHLQKVAEPVYNLAVQMQRELPESPEKIVGMRKLLEAKDCFVRAAPEKEPEEQIKIVPGTVRIGRDVATGQYIARCMVYSDSRPSVSVAFSHEYTDEVGYKYNFARIVQDNKESILNDLRNIEEPDVLR